jgi:AmiR/NasT family two-component response regulator
LRWNLSANSKRQDIVVGDAMSSAQAIEVTDNMRPDFVFLDIRLLDGPTGADIGHHLTRRQTPFVFVTGNLKRIPDNFAGGIGALEKPIARMGCVMP